MADSEAVSFSDTLQEGAESLDVSQLSEAEFNLRLQEIEDSQKRGEVFLEEQIDRIGQLLQLLREGRLTSDQAAHVARTFLPKLVLMLLKLRTVGTLLQRVNQFFQVVLQTVVFMLRTTDIWEMVESASRILTDGASYQFYLIPSACQLPRNADTQSSGEGSPSDASAAGDGLFEADDNVLKHCSPSDDISPYYRRNVQYFNHIGGFQVLIDRLKRQPLPSLTAVRSLIRPFLKARDMLKLPTLQGYIAQLSGTMLEYMAALSDEQLKLEDRKSIGELRRCLDVLLHASQLPDAGLCLERLHLALALKCLKTPNLEKRLCGLSDIKESVNLCLRKAEYVESLERVERERKVAASPLGDEAAAMHAASHAAALRLVQWIQREQVVELIFGEGLHDQIVRRCVEARRIENLSHGVQQCLHRLLPRSVLCFLAMRDALDASVLQRIWRSSLDKHESVKQAVYLVLVDLTGHLSPPLLDCLYALIQSLALCDYTPQTLSLLRGFAIAAIQSPANATRSERRWYGLQELWELMQERSPVSAEVRLAASNMLAELLTWQQCASQRTPMLRRCVAQLDSGASVPQVLRLCSKILGSYSPKPRKKGESVQQVLVWLVGECRLLSIFFTDLTRYHQAAVSRLHGLAAAASGAGHANAQQAAVRALRQARALHMQQVQERIEFLSFCLVSAPLKLERAQLDALWDACVVGRSCAQEADLVFHWLESARTNSAHALDGEATRHLFARASALPLEHLSPAGYACVEYLFRWLNWHERRFTQRDGTHVSVLDLPLFGCETLWQVALRARNEQVGQRAVSFLILLYDSLAPHLAQLQAAQRREFVRLCMTSLGESASKLLAMEQAADDGSEPRPRIGEDGAGLTVAHAGLTVAHAGLAIAGAEAVSEEAAVASESGSASGDERDGLKLCVERSLTLLRLFVEEVERKWPRLHGAARHGAASRGASMRVAVMLVGASNSPRPTVVVHSNQTVGDLRLRIWHELELAAESEPPSMLRLISGGRELKEDWQMLGELKLRVPYAVHVMRRPSMHKAAEPTAAPHATEIGDGGGDDDGDGGGDGDGDGDGDGGDSGADAAVAAERTRALQMELAASMPAQLLSDVGSNFKTLFELLTLKDERLSGRAWQLLMMLPTNAAMRAALAELPTLPAHTRPDWRALLHDGHSACKLFYSLQIVDALVHDDRAVACAPDAAGLDASGRTDLDGGGHHGGAHSAGTTWADAFVAKGGLEYIVSLLFSPQALLDPSRGSQWKPCLLLLLRLLGNFLLAEVREYDASPAAAKSAQLQPFAGSASPASETGLWLLWAQRAYSTLRRSESARFAVGLETPLLSLLEHLPSVDCASDVTADESADELDVQIAREALRLLIACMRANSAIFYDAASSGRLVAWLKTMVLQCRDAELRREVCFALFSFASDTTSKDDAANSLLVTAASTDTVVSADAQATSSNVTIDANATIGANATMGAAAEAPTSNATLLISALFELLPPGPHAQRSQQYFELVQALLATGTCQLPLSPLEQCECLVGLLHAHTPLERRDRPALVDQQLLGYLKLLLTIVRGQPRVRRVLGADGLMSTLFDALFMLRSSDEARALGPAAPPACKSQECRAVAYAVLVELAEGEPDNLEQLLRLQLKQQLQRSGANAVGMQWHYMPAAQEKAPCGYVGLRNLGATCYFNALAQQLFMIPEYRAAILELPVSPPVSATNATRSQKAASDAAGAPQPTSAASALAPAPPPNRDLLYHLQVMFGYLQESEKRSFDTKDFCAAYRDFENVPMNPSIQMDVDEFLTHLFDQLENSLRSGPQPMLMQSLFGGTLVNQIVSKEGRKLSERVENFYVIPIEVKSKNSILDGLAQFVEGEVLDGDNKYKCDDTQEYVEAVKRCCVHSLPPVLILHLKRFEFDYDLMKKMKVNDHCEFPPTIDMRPYTVEWLEAQERAAQADDDGTEAHDSAADAVAVADAVADADADADTQLDGLGATSASSDAGKDAEGQGYVYQLVGVLVHTGTADSGHYYSFIKERRRGVPCREGAPSHGTAAGGLGNIGSGGGVGSGSTGGPNGASAAGASATGGGAGGGTGVGAATKPTSCEWLHFNDTLVEWFDERDIGKCCFGGIEPFVAWDSEGNKHIQRTQIRQNSAYMLFYERRSAVEHGAADRAACNAAQAEATAGPAYEAIVSERFEGAAELARSAPPAARPVYGADAARGSGVLMDSAVSLSVPELIASKVWAENMQFLRDRYVIDPLHFECLHRIVGMALKAEATPLKAEVSDAPDAADVSETRLATAAHARVQLSTPSHTDADATVPMLALQLGCHFFAETLAHSRDKSTLPDWLAMLQVGLRAYVPACRWLLLHARKAGWLRQLLLVCTIPEMRAAFAQLLLHAMRCLRPLELHLYGQPQLQAAEDAAAHTGELEYEPQDTLAREGAPVEMALEDGQNADAADAMECESERDEQLARQVARALVASDLESCTSLSPAAAERRAGSPLDESDDGCDMDVESKAPAAATPLRAKQARSRHDDGPGRGQRLSLPPLPAERAASLETISVLLSMLRDAPQHWRHFSQFFELLSDFAQLGAEERQWLLHRRVITQLVDFYLGDESPLATSAGAHHRQKRIRMGDKFTLPNLEHMLTLLSLLARASIRPDAPERTPLSLPQPLLRMARDEYELLMHPALLRKLLKDGVNVVALSELVQHCCFGLQEQSTTVLHCILQGIDSMDAEALGPYLHLYCAYILLADEHQQWRTQFAMQRLLRVIASNMRYKQATISCLRMLIDLSSHKPTRQWLLQHRGSWLQEWLLGGHSDAVRCTAEHLCYMLLAPEVVKAESREPMAEECDETDGMRHGSRGNCSRSGSPTADGAERHALHTSLDAECPPSVGLLFELAVSLLPQVAVIVRDAGASGKGGENETPSPRLGPFFRVCAWCARHGATSRHLDMHDLTALYAAQDQHRWECDEVKKEMLSFWLAALRAAEAAKAAADANGGDFEPPPLAAPPTAVLQSTFKRLLDSFVSLRPNERFLAYNRAALPSFYSLLECMLAMKGGRECLDVLQSHRNWEWATKYLLIESQEYVQLLRPAGSEPSALGASLHATVRACCAAFPTFRQRILATALAAKKLPANAANILPLLSLCMAESEESVLACELGALPQLCACLDAASPGTLLAPARRESLSLVLVLVSRCVSSLACGAAHAEQTLSAWRPAATAQSLLTILFLLLSASMRLGWGCDAPAVQVPPSPELQVVCCKLACSLAALDAQCATVIIQTLLSNHATSGTASAPSTAMRMLGAAAFEDDEPLAERPLAAGNAARSLPHREAEAAAAFETPRDVAELETYYAFAAQLLLASMEHHGNACARLLALALRLSLCLVADATALPSPHALVARAAISALQLSSCSLEQDEETKPLARTLLIRQVVGRPAMLLRSTEARQCCTAVLNAAPSLADDLEEALDAAMEAAREATANASAHRSAPPHKVSRNAPVIHKEALRMLLQPTAGSESTAKDQWKRQLSKWCSEASGC